MAWQIDFAHSHVQFSARHMMISKVRGEFQKFSGTVALDENDPGKTTLDIQIDASTISTRDEKRDAHLRSADFLTVDTYPTLTFKSTRVDTTGPLTARLHGDLTIKGVTHPVVLNVESHGKVKSPWGTESYGFEAHTVISRKEWGLTWNVALDAGGILVGDDVHIDIEMELVYQA
jgi:polyisoprenoid-binding protein YceI